MSNTKKDPFHRLKNLLPAHVLNDPRIDVDQIINDTIPDAKKGFGLMDSMRHKMAEDYLKYHKCRKQCREYERESKKVENQINTLINKGIKTEGVPDKSTKKTSKPQLKAKFNKTNLNPWWDTLGTWENVEKVKKDENAFIDHSKMNECFKCRKDPGISKFDLENHFSLKYGKEKKKQMLHENLEQFVPVRNRREARLRLNKDQMKHKDSRN